MIGTTTAPDANSAQKLAASLVQAKLAACVQISGPLTSHYQWQGKAESSEEYRLTIKFLATHSNAIAQWLQTHHPYEIPEWIATEAAIVSPAYATWAQSV